MGIGTCLGLASLAGLQTGRLNGYQLWLSDNLQPTGAVDDRLLIVGIDQRAIAQAGSSWPWPRTLHAELLGKLAGADVIVYDVLFSPRSADDATLAAAVHDRVVLAARAEALTPSRAAPLYEAENLERPVASIAREGGVGHANVTPDPADGVVRSLPLVVDTADGRLVPSLALAALELTDRSDEPLTIRPDNVVTGRRAIPTAKFATLDIAFAPELRAGVRDAPIVSAGDVLDGKVTSDEIEARVVFVGVTDPALGDDRATPVAKRVEMPGVLIHANAYNTMVTGHYLRPVGNVRTALGAGVLAAAIALLTILAPVSLGPVATVLALGGYVLWAFVQFDSGTVLNLLYPTLAMALAFVAALSFRYFTELRMRRRVASLFSQYVPRVVADELIASGRVDDAVRGERLTVSVLFCDLRGFTATAARLEPAHVRDLLNVFYDETARLVHAHNGTLLAYVGDEVFAAWGAPVPDADGASKAVLCARALQDASSGINDRLAKHHLPPIAYGIGVHTGEVIAAHVGSDVHRQYTMIGDSVNCGSRLCTLAGRNEIVVSSETYDGLADRPPAQVLPGIRLKGVGRDLLPHRLWPDELRDPSGEDRRGKTED